MCNGLWKFHDKERGMGEEYTPVYSPMKIMYRASIFTIIITVSQVIVSAQ